MDPKLSYDESISNKYKKEKKMRKKDFLIYNEERLKGKVKPKLYEIIN